MNKRVSHSHRFTRLQQQCVCEPMPPRPYSCCQNPTFYRAYSSSCTVVVVLRVHSLRLSRPLGRALHSLRCARPQTAAHQFMRTVCLVHSRSVHWTARTSVVLVWRRTGEPRPTWTGTPERKTTVCVCVCARKCCCVDLLSPPVCPPSACIIWRQRPAQRWVPISDDDSSTIILADVGRCGQYPDGPGRGGCVMTTTLPHTHQAHDQDFVCGSLAVMAFSGVIISSVSWAFRAWPLCYGSARPPDYDCIWLS